MSQRQKRRKEREAESRKSRKHKSAILRYLRMSPRKVRAVARVVEGKKVEEALAILDFTYRAAARPLIKMLKAAVANASSAGSIDVDALVLKEIRVDVGPTLRRFMPRAMGRATQIRKRTSHVTCLLEERA